MNKISTGFLEESNFLIKLKVVFKHELIRKLLELKDYIFEKKKKQVFKIKQRYSEFEAKKIVFKKDLSLNNNYQISWFYTAFERKDQDPLTNYILHKIDSEFDFNKSILITGCGTGIMVFHLSENFYQVDGIDLLEKCISIAKSLKTKFNYKNTNFYAQDCFNPSISKSYDVITVLHWIYSAWMGNYGNNKISDPFSKNTREDLLKKFLEKYKKFLNPKGILIIELIDSIADFRISRDHKAGEASRKIYPVRHSYSQVKKISKELNFSILEAKSCFSYGHHPRMVYLLQKNS